MNKEVLVFSIALKGYSVIFKDCIKTHRTYCSKFNFNCVLIDKAPRSLLPTEAAWLKILLLRAALLCGYEWVAFIDADCEIRKHTPSFKKVLEELPEEKKIFMAHGFSGRINSGVIFMKNSKEALDYLEKVISTGDEKVPMEDRALYENGHMIHYGKNNQAIHILDFEKWNNNSFLDSRSFIQHYSGGYLRKEYLKKRPLISSYHRINKFLKRIISRFSGPQPGTSMLEIETIMPFYSDKFPEFRTEKKY